MSSALAARSLTAYASTPGASSPSFWLDTKNLGKGSPSVTQPHRAQPKPRRSLQKSHTQVTFIRETSDACDIHPVPTRPGARRPAGSAASGRAGEQIPGCDRLDRGDAVAAARERAVLSPCGGEPADQVRPQIFWL